MGLLPLLLAAAAFGLFHLAGGRPGPAELPAAAASPAPLPLTSPAGWPRGQVARFAPDTLFEKIDGKADAYIAYDVAGLDFASYTSPGQVDAYVDVYLFDMGRPLHAFGIYRAQRSGAEEAAPLGDEACAPGLALFARKGRFYVEVLASSAGAGAEARALAAAVTAALPAGREQVGDPAWFPKDGLTIVRYDRRNCLMVEALSDAFLALYADGSKALVATYPSAREAEAAAQAARESFEFLGEPARFEVVGARVAGVVGAAGSGRLAAVVERLQR